MVFIYSICNFRLEGMMQLAKRQRYKHYWFGNVVNMVKRYPAIKNEGSIQSALFTMAIEKTLKEIEGKKDAESILELVDLLYFSKTCTMDGAALKLNISRRTAQRWSSDFIYSVGKNAGYV